MMNQQNEIAKKPLRDYLTGEGQIVYTVMSVLDMLNIADNIPEPVRNAMISTIFIDLDSPRGGEDFERAIERYNEASKEIYNTTLRYQPYAEKLANATSLEEMKSVLVQLQFALQGNKKGI